MNKERAFLEINRKNPSYRPVKERINDFNPVEIRLTEDEIKIQAMRCMDCGVPFCHGYGCPLTNTIPEVNEHISNGRWKEAWQIISTTNPFPEFTGRICPAPCEASCVAGLNGEPVTIRQIELAVAEKAFEYGFYLNEKKVENKKDKKVAIIGSGPAGLAAAYYLNKHGYEVTVYENAPKPGGILRYGIPNFKLEKGIVDRRIKLMEQSGIIFETNVEVGKDISARYIHTRFDAVILAGGARQPRGLDVPGKELKGIFFAMPYLIQQTRILDGEIIPEDKVISAKNKNVIVIGGGDTGADCVGTALRQGAKSVTQIEILPEPPKTRPPETPWPEWPLILRESSSHKEGGKRLWGVLTKKS
ncbi:MAG TPA: glutamate synthase subunit beta [Victivallales bacterium]|nr:glutamate synthase subunit beta [Victivallales bacterium]